MGKRFLWLLVCVALLASYAPPTHAQPPANPPASGGQTPPAGEAPPQGGPEHDDQAARWLFNSAREAFEAGDYESALDRFEQSYRLSNRPALLYNIGTTLDRLRRDADALAAFERYLELVPDSANRSEIEARVIVLQRAVDRREAEEAERARIEQERLAAEEARRRAEQDAQEARTQIEEEEGIPAWAFWTVAGGAGAGLALGVTFHGMTAGRNGVYEDYVTAHMNDPATDNPENLRIARGLYDDAIAMRKAAIISYSITGALAIGAGVMIPFTNWGNDGGDDDAVPPEGAIPPEGDAPSGEVGLRLGPGSLTLGLTQRF